MVSIVTTERNKGGGRDGWKEGGRQGEWKKGIERKVEKSFKEEDDSGVVLGIYYYA